MKRFSAVLFDLDGTLSLRQPTGEQLLVDYVRSLGFPIREETARRAEHWTHFYFANSLQIQQDGKHFKDESAFWLNYTRRKLIALEFSAARAGEFAPQVSAHMRENLRPESFVPADAFSLLETLRTKGYILGVVSNREQPYAEKLQKMKLDSYFHFSLAGGEIPAFKPDRAIFERALQLAGSAADQTLYVGDNYFADVVGAQRAGLSAALYDPNDLFADFPCPKIKTFADLWLTFTT